MSDGLLKALHETAQGLNQAGTLDALTFAGIPRTMSAANQGLQRGANQAAASTQQGESGGVRGVSKHERIDGTEMGARSETAERTVTEVA